MLSSRVRSRGGIRARQYSRMTAIAIAKLTKTCQKRKQGQTKAHQVFQSNASADDADRHLQYRVSNPLHSTLI